MINIRVINIEMRLNDNVPSESSSTDIKTTPQVRVVLSKLYKCIIIWI